MNDEFASKVWLVCKIGVKTRFWVKIALKSKYNYYFCKLIIIPKGVI